MTSKDTPRHCLVCPGDRIAPPPVPRGSARYQMCVVELGCSQRPCLVRCFVNAYEVGTLCVQSHVPVCMQHAPRVSVKKAGVQLWVLLFQAEVLFTFSGAGAEGTAVQQMCPAGSGICSPEGSPSFSHFMDENPEVGGGAAKPFRSSWGGVPGRPGWLLPPGTSTGQVLFVVFLSLGRKPPRRPLVCSLGQVSCLRTEVFHGNLGYWRCSVLARQSRRGSGISK